MKTKGHGVGRSVDGAASGRKFTRRRFVAYAAVGVGTVAVGTAGTVGSLLLYGSSEGTADGEATVPTDKPARTAPKRLAGDEAPKAAGVDVDEETKDADAVEGQDGSAGDAGVGNGASSGSGSGSGSDSGSGSGSGAGNGSGSGSGSGSGAGNGSGSGSGSGSKQKWHEGWNEWVVDEPGHNETRVVHHPEQAYDRAVYGTRCDCGYTTTGSIWPHIDANPGREHSGYVTGVQIGTERVVVQPAWDEEVTEWVPEKGHYVWHEGYWE